MYQFKVITVGSLANRLGWYKNKQEQRYKAMMFVLCLLVEALSVLSASVVGTTPVESLNDRNNTKYLSAYGEYFEGDIILLPEQINYIRQSQNADDSVKSLISDPTALWPGKTVYYDFAPGEFSLAQRQTIISALNDIMFASCIRFIRRTTQPTYVVLRNNGIGTLGHWYEDCRDVGSQTMGLTGQGVDVLVPVISTRSRESPAGN
ncbi:uncharacterized protein LOC124358870 [Homalodisca vitripennis]|uniref:uncharacterized protein LOC124358870 n=1 Tax=Homalodisca vitripennis TaxID=197043 RepID=UPI001EEAA70F|nr:uncharacterized protein LOC124358870 [Homalodisca vitripennis]